MWASPKQTYECEQHRAFIVALETDFMMKQQAIQMLQQEQRRLQTWQYHMWVTHNADQATLASICPLRFF
jgi:hypothetical protein